MVSLVPILTLLCTPLWYLAGKAAQRLHLPSLTGYVLAGMVCSALLQGDPEGQQALTVVSQCCLSLIAIAAGAELQLKELRQTTQQVATLVGGICIGSWAIVYIFMRMVAPSFSFLAKLAEADLAILASFAATVAMARSPASAIAVLKEVGGAGPFCQLAMNIIVVKDIVVFVVFAFVMELAHLGTKAGEGMSAAMLVHPFLSIGMSLVMGGAMGLLLGAISALHAGNRKAQPTKFRQQVAMRSLDTTLTIMPLLVSSATFFLSRALHAEPLLTCVAAGVVASNYSSTQVASLLNGNISRLLPITNVPFFGLTGASLKFDAIQQTAWIAGILFTARLAGIWAGCSLGGMLCGLQPAKQRAVALSMVTQAGIALGLAGVVGTAFKSSWGPQFAALQATVVMGNLLIGPPMFKYAIISSGESASPAGKVGDNDSYDVWVSSL